LHSGKELRKLTVAGIVAHQLAALLPGGEENPLAVGVGANELKSRGVE
jgi:hypothetical protein